MIRTTIVTITLLLFSVIAHSKIIKVDDLGDPVPSTGGTRTLRQAIALVLPGDTILIDVKGTISLSSTITTGANFTIMGAYPIHSELDCKLLSGSLGIDVLAGGNINLLGFAIINSTPAANVRYVRVRPGGTFSARDCVFKNATGNGGGGAFLVEGICSVLNCTYNANATNTNGGGIFVTNGGSLNANSCTFYNNTATLNGAGIRVDNGSLNVLNCTFYNNTAGGLGHAISSANVADAVVVNNNIFTDNASVKWNNLCDDVFSPRWTSDGNVYSQSAGTLAGVINSGANDKVGQLYASINLRANIKVDGYGLEYFPITAVGSVAIDNGITVGGLAQLDCRRAPRSLYGNAGVIPDAGAVEFTPFTVTSPGGPGSFQTVWGQMNATGGFGGKEYMDFDLPGPTIYSLSGSLAYTSVGAPRIVDAYTNPGSSIAGPRDPFVAGTYIVPANLNVTLQSNTNRLLDLDSWPNPSWIAGINFTANSNNEAVLVTNSDIHFFGNHFTSSANDGWRGLHLQSNSFVRVGGNRPHFYNVINNFNSTIQPNPCGIYIQNSTAGYIMGNIIGPNIDGIGAMGNQRGIILEYTSGVTIGGMRNEWSKNIISSNQIDQIMDFQGNNTIIGNLIGTTIGGDVACGALSIGDGIQLVNQTVTKIGGLGIQDGNVIVNQAFGIGANTNSGNNTTVLGNFIGIAAMPPFAILPNNVGVKIIGNGPNGFLIGDGTIKGRNFISGNSSNGIVLDSTAKNQVNKNYIGLKPDGNIAANGVGIKMSGGSNNNQIINNIVSGNTGDGILSTQCGLNDAIIKNFVGTDTSGTIAKPNNGSGINVISSTASFPIDNNLVSGNAAGGGGIVIASSLNGMQIVNNTIGLDFGRTMPIPNSNGINAIGSNSLMIKGNTISGNNADGIYLNNCFGFTIDSNFIGTTPVSFLPLGNNVNGIFCDGNCANGNIGSGLVSANNNIANNTMAGIYIYKQSEKIGIIGNSIRNNGMIGIALKDGTLTPLPNDLNDADTFGTGAVDRGNRGQNTPANMTATVCSATTSISGVVNVDATAMNYLIQVYLVKPGNVDPSGFGEGDSLVGQGYFNPGGINTINWTINLASVFPVGTIFSATCTKEYTVGLWETSEFSDTTITKASTVAIASVINQPSCNGINDGSATVTASGVAPFTYEWFAAPGISMGTQSFANITGLAPGNYWATVYDATLCLVTSDTITITYPPLLNITETPINPSCFGYSNGSITINATGGTGTYYEYSINAGSTFISVVNTFTGLSPGTYYCWVRDTNTCYSNLDTIVLVAPGALNATITPYNETCAGYNNGAVDVTINSGQNPTFTFDFYNSSATLINNVSAIGYVSAYSLTSLVPDNYNLVVTDINGCDDTLSFTILASGNNLSANFTTSGATCFGNGTGFADLSTASPAATSWTYNFGDGGSSTAQNPTYTYTASGTFTAQLIVGNGFCSDTSFQAVTINAPPVVNAGGDFDACESGSGFLFGTVAGASSTIWTSASGATISPATNPVATYVIFSAADISAGYATAILSGTFGACTVTDTVIITLDQNPIINAGPDATICDVSSYTNTAATASSVSTVNWTTSGSGSYVSPTVVGATYNPTGDAGSTVVLTLTAQSPLNVCPSAVDVLNLTVVPSPLANAGLDSLICSSGISYITLNGTSANSPSLIWSTSGSGSWTGVTSFTPNYYFSVADISGGSMYLMLTANGNAPCASVTDSLLITFITPASVFAGTDQTICAGSTVNLSGSASGTVSILWSNGLGTYAPSSSVLATVYTPTLAEEGAGLVSLILNGTPAGTGSCPVATDTINITILATPVSNAGADDTTCVGMLYTLDGTSSTGSFSSQTWTEVGGSFSDTSLITTVSPTVTTSYVLTLDNGSCIDYDTITITITAPSNASFGYSVSSTCPVTTTLSPTAATAGGNWTSSPAGLSLNALNGDIDPSLSVPNTYMIYHSFTSPCFSIDSTQIIINPNPSVVLTPDYKACYGDTVTFIGSPSGGTFSGSTVTTAGVLNTLFSGSGTFVITYTFTEPLTGCTAADTNSIVVLPSPAVSISPILGTTYCPSDGPFLLTGAPLGGAFLLNNVFQSISTFNYDPTLPGIDTIIYAWQDPVTTCIGLAFQIDTVVTGPPTPILSGLPPSQFCTSTSYPFVVSNPAASVTWYADAALTTVLATGTTMASTSLLSGNGTFYVVNSNGGCLSSPLVFNYFNLDASLITFGGPYNSCAGDITNVTVNIPSVTSYQWNFDSSIADTSTLNIIVKPMFSTTYYIYVTIPSGCGIVDSITVNVKPCSLDDISNVFSPDGDGINDTWYINGIGLRPNNRVIVFNRWGDKLRVFENYDNTNSVWDGTYNGVKVATGTYYFTIELFDTNEQKAGWVQVNY